MNSFFKTSRQHQGFSLVELMIAMMLGLFLIGGVISVFLSNREVYRQNENLARMQENARYAFEVLGRDVREAGGIVCGANFAPTNVVTNPSNNWWSSWNDGTNNINGIRGFYGKQNNASFPKAFGTAAASRVEGTDDATTPDALIVLSASTQSYTITTHVPTATPPTFTLNTTSHRFSVGEVIMACDYGKAALFQVTGPSVLNDTNLANDGNTVEHSSALVNAFQSGGQLTPLSASAWYIGFNGRGGRSLYRIYLSGNPEEIAEGVTDLQLFYLTKDASGNLPTSYVRDTTGITDWSRVVAVRMVFTMQSLENVGIGATPLTRTWNTVITLRNRQL